MNVLDTRAREVRAFTLLEVMLAVMIMGMVMSGIYAIWSAALSGWKRSSSISESFQRQRVVMDALEELTSSIAYFGSQNGLYDIQGTRSDADGDSISFVTSSDVLLPPTESSVTGMRRVTIAVYRDRAGNPFLGIINEPALRPTDSTYKSETHVLSYNVCGLQIRYRDPRDAGFKDKWEDPDVIPSGIEFTVAFCSTDRQSPPVIVTRTVDIPTAQFAMQSKGVWMNQQTSTNEVQQRDINLLEPGQPSSQGADLPPGMPQ